jgi:hypothetical protein
MPLFKGATLVGIVVSLLGWMGLASGQVKSTGEEGFVDFDLPLSRFATNPSGHGVVFTGGKFEGEVIGFIVELGTEWKDRPIDGGGATFYWGTVTLRSSGQSSDAFVRAFARKVGHQGAVPPMLADIHAEAVGLNSDPRMIRQQPVAMKLFFHSNNEERYAEVFLNIDLAGKVVQFHEKDPEYRANLIRALTEGA